MCAFERPLLPSPICMPTFVAITTSSRRPRFAIQRPITASESPPR
jgi:hypothetical protein